MRISNLWVTSRNFTAPAKPDKWSPARSGAAASAAPESDGLRVCMFRNYLPEEEWKGLCTKGGGLTAAYRGRIRAAVGAPYIDAFKPSLESAGTSSERITALLRVRKDGSGSAQAASGLGGVYIKPLDSVPAGAIAWNPKRPDEADIAHAERIRRLDEQGSNRGVAFWLGGSARRSRY